MGLLLPTLFDVLFWLVWLVVHALSAAAGIVVANALWGPSVLQQGFAITAGYGAFLHAFVLVLCLLKRVLQPKLRASADGAGSGRAFVAWGLNSVFQGVFLSSFAHNQVHFLFWLRFAYYRLMGMRLHPGVVLGTGAVLRQVELIRIGRGSVVGIGASISCHLNPDGKTHLQASVTIGARSLIGTMSALGPGTTVGDDCVIGLRSTLPHAVTVGDGATLGSGVLVKPGTTIGAGARVLSHAVVVQDVPPGEIWSGNPAVRVTRTPEVDSVGASDASDALGPAAPVQPVRPGDAR